MRVLRLLWRVVWRLKAVHWVYVLLHVLFLVIGFFLVMTKATVAVAIGGSLIAAAMAGLVLFLHAWLSQGERQRLQILRKFGFVEAFELRSVGIKHEYDAHLNTACEAIDILGFGLRALREDYRGTFASWADRATVRILLLDPEFLTREHSLADQRDSEENDDRGTIARDVQAFVRACADLLQNGQSRFQVRLFRCLPSVNIFRVDGNLFWGPYLIGEVSRNLPTFLVSQPGLLYDRLLNHFDAIWSSDTFSRPVPTEWFIPHANEGGS